MPDEGQVLLDAEALRSEHIRDIGYLPEERGLYKSMKVGEQALYLARLKGLSKSEARERLQYWFKKFEIEDWWGKKIQELSKGQAQKIQFIVTVLHQPKLLIFDEPFSGFDPINANRIKDEILQLREEGATVIFSTHRMESVEELCDDIALIHKSQKILEGPLQEIKRQFKSNSFEVGLLTDQPDKVLQEIEQSFQVLPAHFKSLDDDLKITVKSRNGSVFPNEVLSFLTSLAQVNHFVELIPSANDIFIETIKKH
jgi:ABC-2 type transport system ATP-binding protein